MTTMLQCKWKGDGRVVVSALSDNIQISTNLPPAAILVPEDREILCLRRRLRRLSVSRRTTVCVEGELITSKSSAVMEGRAFSSLSGALIVVSGS